MKRMLILLGASAVLAVTVMAQIYMPPPPRPPMCHDEVICTSVCRWVTVCN
jgi:hypothetical protein